MVKNIASFKAKDLFDNKCVKINLLPHPFLDYLLALNVVEIVNNKVCGMFSDNMANLEKDIFFKKIGFEYIKYFYSIPSTMDYAKKIADKYNRAIIFSEIQTRGRGRAGRIWLSPPGGIWTTITWSIENMHMLNILSLAIGVSVIKALSNVLLLSFKLKWPNDVMFSAKKIGGILIENIFRERKVLSIIGIGLNVNNKMKFSGLSGVTSISEVLGFNVPRDVLLKAIALEVVNTLRRKNRREIINSWKKADITLGRKIIIKLSQGGIVEGKALDISNTGGLLIKDNSGRIIEVHCGDVVYLEGVEYKPIS